MRPQNLMYGERANPPAALLQFTRYEKIVEALGGHGEYCERPEEIGPAIQRAIDSGKPALVNIKIRQDRGAPKGSPLTQTSNGEAFPSSSTCPTNTAKLCRGCLTM